MNESVKECEQAERAGEKATEQRKEVGARLSTLDKGIAALERQIADLDRALELAIREDKRRGPIRSKRDKLELQRNDLKAERTTLATWFKNAEHQEAAALVKLHQTIRLQVQAEGIAARDQIVVLIDQIREHYARLQRLSDEDRKSKDIIRSIASERLDEVSTFSWSSGIDDAFSLALQSIIHERDRTERRLKERQAS